MMTSQAHTSVVDWFDVTQQLSVFLAEVFVTMIALAISALCAVRLRLIEGEND